MTILQFILGIFLTWCIWAGGFDGFVTGIILLVAGGAAMDFFGAKSRQAEQEKALEESAKAAAFREWELMRWASMRNETWRKMNEENQPKVIHIVEVHSKPASKNPKKHNNPQQKQIVEETNNSDVIDI